MSRSRTRNFLKTRYGYSLNEIQHIKDVLVYGLRNELEQTLLGFNCVPFLGQKEEKQICAEINRVMKKVLAKDIYGKELYEQLLLSKPHHTREPRNTMIPPSDTFREMLAKYGTFWKYINTEDCENGLY